MDRDTALPSWIVFLLIALGAALAVGIALLLTQLDALQQRTLLPPATLPVIDVQATMTTGDLTVVVIAGEEIPTNTPTSSSTPIPQTMEPITAEPIREPFLVPSCAAAPDGWIPYTVQEGDTLATLSMQLGIDVEMLLQANCLTQPQLLPEQTLFLPVLIPTRAAGELCSAPAGWLQYIVAPGDSLANLAEERQVDVAWLLFANCLDNVEVIPGRTLFLPPIPDQREMQPPGLPAWLAYRTPPGRPSAARPTAEFPEWPTRRPWPIATPTLKPSPTTTSIAFVTASPTVASTPEPTNTPEAPLPAETSGAAYPGKATTSTATIAAAPKVGPTVTASATATTTFTPSPTTTFTNTPSSTPSPTPQVTDTPTPTVTDTPTPLPTETATATGFPTPAATYTPPAYPYP